MTRSRSAAAGKEHITVCVCTYKRPELLRKLLEHLDAQETNGLFTVSASIVDNDVERSAEPVIDEFRKSHQLEIVYSHVPERNLALLRNVSVDRSVGEYVAFIDDDEYPQSDWLLLLYNALNQYQVSGAFGPVVPDFQRPPPSWIVQARLCERERLKTGTILGWTQTRCGNALLRREMLLDPDNRFHLRFRVGGEDDTLFKRLLEKGHRFVWHDEAAVHEAVPAARLTYSYFKKRNLLIGFINYRYLRAERSRLKNAFFVLKSVSALTIYQVLGPFLLPFGYHRFVKLRTRYFYHKGVLLTFLGLVNYEQRDL